MREEPRNSNRGPVVEQYLRRVGLGVGSIFIMDHGHGMGHTGLDEQCGSGWITTIEGNTDASRTREGGGVYRLTRKITEINRGFIQYPA